MAELTPEQIDELVAVANERLDAREIAESPAPSAPTKVVWYVRSDVTGAIVGTHEGESAEAGANDEAQRMNDEARRGGVRHEGMKMSYHATGPVEVTDDIAQLESVIDELNARRNDTADDDTRALFDSELEQREAELSMYRDGTLEARRAEASEVSDGA